MQLENEKRKLAKIKNKIRIQFLNILELELESEDQK